MNKKNLVKIINKELTILSDFVEGFHENENINPIVVDLALSKVKDIYDELLMLKEVESKGPGAIIAEVAGRKKELNKPQFIEKTPQKQQVDDVEEPKAIEDIEIEQKIEKTAPLEEEPGIDVQEIVQPALENEIAESKEEQIEELAENKVEQIEVPAESELDENETLVAEPEIMEEEVRMQEAPEEVVEATGPTHSELVIKKEKANTKEPKPDDVLKGEIIADKFSKDALSVNDMLAGVKKNKDLASLLKDSPIPDLKRAIKLNDRIWFINELFNKNASTFEKAVDEVNKSANLDLALEYLFTNFKWDQNRKSTINFLELVFRRFASN